MMPEYKMRPILKVFDIKGFFSFFYSEKNKDSYFAGERHNFWEVVYVDSGEFYVTADERGYVLKQGDMIFHKPMEYHAFTANRSHPYNILVTSFACFSDAMSFFEDKVFTLTSKQKRYWRFL